MYSSCKQITTHGFHARGVPPHRPVASSKRSRKHVGDVQASGSPPGGPPRYPRRRGRFCPEPPPEPEDRGLVHRIRKNLATDMNMLSLWISILMVAQMFAVYLKLKADILQSESDLADNLERLESGLLASLRECKQKLS